MIREIIFAAAALLLLQIGLTVAVYQQQAVHLESTAPNSAFLSFAPESITSIQINGSDNATLLLQKGDKGWIMPKAFSAPASQRQVDDLLHKLANARQGLAVATSKGAAKRFKTAQDNFERHIILKQGDSVAEDFYLGTSAGMRNSHARKADQQAVVSIPVGSHEVDTDADSWLDRSLADLNKDDLKALSLDDISLTKNKEGDKENWILTGASKEDTKQEAVEKLLNQVTAISVQSVLDPVQSAKLFTQDPAVQFTVTKQNDSKVTYAFAQQDDYFVLKMSDNALYFKVGKWLVEDLTEAKREKLLVRDKEEPKVEPVAQETQPVEQSATQEEGTQKQAEKPVQQETPSEKVAVPEEPKAEPVAQETQPVEQSAKQEEGTQKQAEKPVQQETPSEKVAVPEEPKAEPVAQETQPVEQSATQEEGTQKQAEKPVQQEAPSEKVAVPEEPKAEPVAQKTQPVEQSAKQEEVSKEEATK